MFVYRILNAFIRKQWMEVQRENGWYGSFQFNTDLSRYPWRGRMISEKAVGLPHCRRNCTKYRPNASEDQIDVDERSQDEKK